jgi:predicted 3-demethylubiquinone-9 3-methyltransferase (glyoxalase superfamily)
MAAVLPQSEVDSSSSSVERSRLEAITHSQVEDATFTDLTPQQVLEAVVSEWPDDPEAATSILHCESSAGTDPDTWNLAHPDGGPLQINKATWAAYFKDKYGWTWSQVVRDLETHLAAAREIYDKTGDWSLWACSPSVKGAA